MASDFISEREWLLPRFAAVEVGLHHVAQSLRQMRSWLSEQGSRGQIFHCARKDMVAEIRVEFAYRDGELRDRFQAAFGHCSVPVRQPKS